MLVIRFFRVGKKKQPSFKIVVTDKKNPPKGGRFVDEVGSWNPLTKDKRLDETKIKDWILKGAKPSPSVYNLFVDEGILTGAKLPVHKKKKEKAGQEIKPVEKKKEVAEKKPEEPEVKAAKEEKSAEEKAEEPKEKAKEEKPVEEKKEELKPEEAKSEEKKEEPKPEEEKPAEKPKEEAEKK